MNLLVAQPTKVRKLTGSRVVAGSLLVLKGILARSTRIIGARFIL